MKQSRKGDNKTHNREQDKQTTQHTDKSHIEKRNITRPQDVHIQNNKHIHTTQRGIEHTEHRARHQHT